MWPNLQVKSTWTSSKWPIQVKTCELWRSLFRLLTNEWKSGNEKKIRKNSQNNQKIRIKTFYLLTHTFEHLEDKNAFLLGCWELSVTSYIQSHKLPLHMSTQTLPSMIIFCCQTWYCLCKDQPGNSKTSEKKNLKKKTQKLSIFATSGPSSFSVPHSQSIRCLLTLTPVLIY